MIASDDVSNITSGFSPGFLLDMSFQLHVKQCTDNCAESQTCHHKQPEAVSSCALAPISNSFFPAITDC